jgi:hypothetical protein
MFHKAKTEKERQKIFDEYLLGILKRKKVIKTNQKIIDESGFSFDPELENNKVKGAFNNYVDTLVVKNYMIEQLQTRLKISKSLSTQFVNKLNGNQILILSKNLNDFIKYIDDNHNNINDYILLSSFNNLQKNYNITIQQEKNKEVIRDNQQETGEILQESIPADELEEAEEEEAEEETEADKGPVEEPEDPDDDSEINKFVEFLEETVFQIKGVQGYGHARIKKELLGIDLKNGNYDYYSKLTTKEISDTYFNELLPVIQELDTQKKQKRERILIQETFKISFLNSFPAEIVGKNEKLFTDEIVGTGYGMNTDSPPGGGSLRQETKNNTYINIGKYLVHRNNLLGGKLQVRSPNKNQVYGFKSQNITNNIKDILLKLNKKEPISFKDVDKLNEQEKNQLYTIGKKLHVSELFDIPSTLKSNEDKLKDEFFLLRGSIMAGNNNPELLRKFKIVLLKMKNNKLISLQEYNEVLNILLEIDI